MTGCDAIAGLLRAARFSCGDEDDLQVAVAALLDEHGIQYQREVRLSPRDRVDFLIDGGIALELKVKTTPKSLLAQLLRYASHPSISGLIAASTTHHALRLPTEVNGKPLRTVQLMRW